jgi:phosphoenolpyruvate carboxykinase (ATP)
MPGGKIYATENGCFAKTFALNENDEPTIFNAVTSKHAYLENVSQNDAGELDFYDTSYTQNGRAVVRMEDIAGAMDAREIKSADFLLILNRNDNIIPGVARLNRHQAAAYFMLGETRGTSAGGVAEAGKFLRVPGTNPFFPLKHAQQGNRFWELLESSPMEVYLMNTGRVGGRDEDERSKKVRIQHSSAMVKGIAEGTIEWENDVDFGYQVARSVPGMDAEDNEILQPRKLYERQGRAEEYAQIVERLKNERREYMAKWEGLNPKIAQAAG